MNRGESAREAAIPATFRLAFTWEIPVRVDAVDR